MENSDNQFEFGSVTTTPGSPKSPADHLFSNGKLLPHVFPVDQNVQHNNFSFSRSTSRSTSSSRDSLMSSRCNSTNSRSSNCSSARTSTSDQTSENRSRLSVSKERSNRPVSINHQSGSSRRWQFIAAAPELKHSGSRSRTSEINVLDRKGSKRVSTVAIVEESCGRRSSWFGGRILKSFVSACKECHSIN